MKVIGKTTIHPLLFYSGKVCGYITWILLVFDLLNIPLFAGLENRYFKIMSLGFLCIGLIFTAVSLVNLGKSTRLGLPSEATALKTGGIYHLSRNPMYLGFNLFTLASILYNLNVIITAMGLYSIVIYHFIILGEEAFLEKRFENDYINIEEL
jgi:protein-S-isoprenylcysteine O-methyltransferase Ste14